MRTLIVMAMLLPTLALAAPCGDVNGDGQVTLSDGVNVLRGDVPPTVELIG